MSTYTIRSSSHGAVFRPQEFRVLYAPVRAHRDGQGGWGSSSVAMSWFPQKVQWASNGRMSTMELKCGLGSVDGNAAAKPEHLHVRPGDRFVIEEIRSRGGRRELFRGYASQGSLTIQSQPDLESACVVAYGPELILRNRSVTGAWFMSTEIADVVAEGSLDPAECTRQNVVETHFPVIFNEQGRPNASDSQWSLASETSGERKCRVFAFGGRDVIAWDACSALRSVVEWFDGEKVISLGQTDWAAIEACASIPLGEVNITGMSLLEAIGRILLPVGLGFCLEPWAQSDGRHRLRVWPLHGQANCPGPFLGDRDNPAPVDSARGRRCNVQRLEFVRDNHNVTNEVLVIGQPNRREVTLTYEGIFGGDLQPYWDTQEYDLTPYTSGTLIGGEWTVEQYRQFSEDFNYLSAKCMEHVYRSFVWNEDGGLCPVVETVPDMSDEQFEGIKTRRPRPVGDRIDTQPDLREAPRISARVELGVRGNDASWLQIPARIWPDRAGFTITQSTLHDWYPYATEEARAMLLVSGKSMYDYYCNMSYLSLLYRSLNYVGFPTLALRVIGTIELDECVVGKAEYRSDSSWPLRSQKVVYAPHRFKSSENAADDASDPQIDPATAYAHQIRDVLEDAVGHGSCVLQGIDRSYNLGDAFSSTRGRRVGLGIRGREQGQRESFSPVIVGIVWDFREGVSKTELVLESDLLRMRH